MRFFEILIVIVIIITSCCTVSCRDELPEIKYDNINIYPDNPDVIEALRKILMFEEYDDIISITGPYIVYNVSEDGTISLGAGQYYVELRDRGCGIMNLYINEAYIDENQGESSIDIAFYHSPENPHKSNPVIDEKHIIFSNIRYACYITETEIIEIELPPTSPDKAADIKKTVTELAEKYGDELYSFCQPLEVPLELLKPD